MTTVIVPKTDHKIDGLQFTITVYTVYNYSLHL